MPVDIDPLPNERVLVNVKYQASSRSVPFALGITDQAVYVPAKKLWARDDPWYIFTEGKYSWMPPVVVDKGSRDYIRQLLDHIIGGFRSAGVQVGE